MKDNKPDNIIDNFIDWSPDSLSRKRKREKSGSEQIDHGIQESYATDLKPPSLVQTISPRSSSIASPSDTSLPDLQDLLHPRQVPLSDTIMPALDESVDLQEVEPDITALKDDLLFSTFLRSRSSSCFSKQGNSDYKASQLQHSPTQAACHFMESSLNPAESVERDVIEIPDRPTPTKKPRIILRLCPSEVEAKPRIKLRLKKPDAKSSTKQSNKVIIGRIADGHIDLKRSQDRRRQTSAQESTAVEVRTTSSRRTRIGREIKPTKKATKARKC